MNTISVLHVDDDPDVSDLVAASLEREHEAIDVVSETDPYEAVRGSRRITSASIVS